jgi:hypothetical protein
MCLNKQKHATAKHTMPYNERIRMYANEKKFALELCTTQEEVDRELNYLRKKWAV